MPSTLDIFLANNQVMSPTHIAIDGHPLGWIKKDSAKYTPGANKIAFEADQIAKNIGSIVTDTNGGTLSFAAIELTDTILPILNDWNAGTTLTAPFAGTRFNNTPKRECTKRVIEMWKMWSNGQVFYAVVAGETSKPFAMDMGSGSPMMPEVTFDLVVLSNSYPDGFTDLYNAVSGALTATFVPADNATGVAAGSAVTVTFNKPLPALALSGDFWTFVDSEGAQVAFTPSFGTRTDAGLTLLDLKKIVLTPNAALTAGEEYTVTCDASFYALDASTLGTSATASFTVAGT